MRNTFDITNLFWQILSSSVELKSTITGDIYKISRPLNSKREDVVIKPLPINFEQLQIGVVNVNIHVPNLQIEILGDQDNTQPNNKRFKVITDLVIDLLDDTTMDDYYVSVQQQVLIQDPDTLEYYSNIRFDIILENITN